MPAVLAIKEKVPPEAIEPLLKLVPSSEVTVWAMGSLLVHVTFVPAFTVVVDGLNVIPVILTAFALPVGGGVLPPALLLPDLLQDQLIIARKISNERESEMVFCFIKTVCKLKMGLFFWDLVH